MISTARRIMDEAVLYSDGRNYKLARLPANAITLAAGLVAEAGAPFSAVVVDKGEVSLMLPVDVCQAFSKRLRLATISELDYRLITIDVVLPLELVGFLAMISAVLAAAQIPILAFAAYSRDHIFVPAARFDDAIAAIESLRGTPET